MIFSSPRHGRSSLVPLYVPGSLRLIKARSWRFGTRGASSLVLLWDDADRFGTRNVYSMAPLRSGADLAVEGSLGNLAKPSPFHIEPKVHAENEEMPEDE